MKSSPTRNPQGQYRLAANFSYPLRRALPQLVKFHRKAEEIYTTGDNLLKYMENKNERIFRNPVKIHQIHGLWGGY